MIRRKTPLKRSAAPKRSSKPLKKTPVKKVRSKARPGRVKGKAMEALRREVFARDFYRCQHICVIETGEGCCGMSQRICHRGVTWETGHLAHRKSRGAGGHDTPENTYCCCEAHHVTFHRNGPSMAKPVPAKPRG